MRNTTRRRRAGRFLAPAAGLLIAALTLTGCGSQIPGEQLAAARPEQQSAAPASKRLNVTTMDGSTVRIGGDRPTVLFFFTPGCRSCEPAARELTAAHRQAGDAAQFLAIDLNPADTPQVITDFLGRVGNADLPAAVDRDTSLTKTFDVTALGTVVIVDSDGTATYRDVEPSTEQIVQALRKAGHQ